MKKDRKEYLKKYRLSHLEKYREYSKKYRENHLSTSKKLKLEKEETISFIRKKLSDIEIELITPKPDIYELGLLQGRYGAYQEILSKLDVLKITESSDK